MAKLTASPDIQYVDLGDLKNDPENTRTKYKEEPLCELADSILEEGIIQNLEASEDGTTHAGNRRLKALKEKVIPYLFEEAEKWEGFRKEYVSLHGEDSKESKMAVRKLAEFDEKIKSLSRVPVRILTADQAQSKRVRQLIENLQREDISIQDEAAGYASLLEEKDGDGKRIHTPDSIARRIGKGRTANYVRKRVKLTNVPPFFIAAQEDGKVGVEHCVHLSRIPDKSARAECGRRILNPRNLDRPLNEEETKELIRKDYQVTLKGCPFDPEQKDLIPDVGPCSKCEFRSGNLKGLDLEFASGRKGGASPNLCTNTACFAKKSAAAWNILQARAEKEDYEVKPAAESETIFSGPNGKLPLKSEWLDLDEKPSSKEAGHYNDSKLDKWRVILRGLDVQVTKVRHPKSGKVHDLVKRKTALAALEVKSTGDDQVAKLTLSESENAERDRKQRAEKRREKRLALETAIRVIDALGDAMSTPAFPDFDPKNPEHVAAQEMSAGFHLDPEALFSILEITLNQSADACSFFAHWLQIEKGSMEGRDFLPVILSLLRKRKPAWTALELNSFIAIASIATAAKYNGHNAGELRQLCAVYDIQVDEIEAEVLKELEAEEEAAEWAEKKKKAGIPDGSGKSGKKQAYQAKADGHGDVKAANAEFERRTKAGETFTIAGLEEEFGLKKDQLRNYRKNKNRRAKA